MTNETPEQVMSNLIRDTVDAAYQRGVRDTFARLIEAASIDESGNPWLAVVERYTYPENGDMGSRNITSLPQWIRDQEAKAGTDDDQ